MLPFAILTLLWKNANKQHISEEIDNMSDEEFLSKHKLVINGKITNAAMVLLLGNKLPDVLNDNQKNSKIKNLLTSLKKSNKIIPIGGNSKNAYWVLFKNEKQK